MQRRVPQGPHNHLFKEAFELVASSLSDCSALSKMVPAEGLEPPTL